MEFGWCFGDLVIFVVVGVLDRWVCVDLYIIWMLVFELIGLWVDMGFVGIGGLDVCMVV